MHSSPQKEKLFQHFTHEIYIVQDQLYPCQHDIIDEGEISMSAHNQQLSLNAKHMACDAPFAIDKTLCDPNPSSSIKKLTSTGHGCIAGSPGTPNCESLAFPHMYNFPLSVQNQKMLVIKFALH
jgi:hypothetical protein